MKKFAPAPHSRLGNTSETIADADKGGAKRIVNGKLKVRVFSRQRKYIRQTNGFSDQRKMFAVAGAIVVKENVDFVGATTGRPRFVKEIFGLLLLLFYGGWTGDQWSPLRGTMRSGIAVTEGGRRRTNISGGVA